MFFCFCLMHRLVPFQHLWYMSYGIGSAGLRAVEITKYWGPVKLITVLITTWIVVFYCKRKVNIVLKYFVMLISIIVASISIFLAWFLWKLWPRFVGKENRHRFFAEVFKEFPVFYNSKTRHLKRKLFECIPTLESSFPDLRKVKGIRILEIGAGPGANLEFYPENTKLLVADPNPFFKDVILKNLKEYPNVELEKYFVTGAEDMAGIPSNSVDVVVSTLVLCSVNDVHRVLQEVRRVLVPGGKFLCMEHVIDDKMSLYKIFQMFLGTVGIFQFLVDGCRPDKDIVKELNNGGFSSVNVTRFRLDLDGVPVSLDVVFMIKPHIYAIATK